MIKFLILIVSLTIISCTNQKELLKQGEQYTIDDIETYNFKIEEFKRVFFKSCLGRSVTRSENIDCYYEFLYSDRSTASDYPLFPEAYSMAHDLSKKVTNQILTDSITWTNTVCEKCNDEELEIMRINGMLGRQSIKKCLAYYASNELDSLAKSLIKLKRNGLY